MKHLIQYKKKYIQYGGSYSGPAPIQFLNFDASPSLRLERLFLIGKLINRNQERFPPNVYYGDIVKRPLTKENSAKGVYCSHVLEHLSLNDCRKSLKNTYKMLEPGGIFRFVLPDLHYFSKLYINGEINSIDFMTLTGLGKEKRNKSFKQLIINFYGNSSHLWMWDFESLAIELSNIGFKNIRRANFADSSDKTFLLVEEEKRWINCLGIECNA